MVSPCRLLTPIVEEIAHELAGKAVVGKLNVDENPATASRFGVRSIPTLIIIEGGKEAERIVGLQSKEAILSRMRPYLAGA